MKKALSLVLWYKSPYVHFSAVKSTYDRQSSTCYIHQQQHGNGGVHNGIQLIPAQQQEPREYTTTQTTRPRNPRKREIKSTQQSIMTKNSLPFIFALFTWTFLPSNTLGYLPSSTQQVPSRQSHTHLFVSSSTDKKNIPGTAKLDKDWEQLGFEFRQTKSNARIVYKNGAWGDIQLVEDFQISLSIGATALHYGQACFEGLKAFAHKDQSVHIFRPLENAARLESSCQRILMPVLPHELFVQACKQVVQDNIAYVPPYGTGGSLYLRPLLFGSGPRIGLQPADEYTFILMVIPVSDYYAGGLSSPVDGILVTHYDRAAPQGVGNVKVAGNYAADLYPNMKHKKLGYPISLYLDAKTQTCIEEFSTSNFVGISHAQKKYLTPKSPSVLPSITNKSLMTIAQDMGYAVEQRDIPLEELDTMDEVLACGTAVVVTPVGSITRLDETSGDVMKKYTFGPKDDEKEGSRIGQMTRALYDRVRAIQFGEAEDKWGWNLKV